ncbi:MAG TPA: glycosyltransferase family 2 protein [Polyangiaceae bacterium]|jgi:glycosyltransferase involved in cell wall biosynthesis|nr:glycosyltransferase family 2 protein [Polyangiaceae bacterium]
MLGFGYVTPAVTICLPTFRRLHYLKEAVAAAQAQSLRNIEVLISDDGDSAEIKRWSEGAVQADSRVRYRRNEKNLGLGGNWNECVSAARGEWVVIQGDDDRLLPPFCEVLLSVAAPDSTVLFSNHYVIDEHGSRLDEESREWTVRYGRHLLARGKVEHAARCVWSNSVPMSSALVRSDAIKRLGIKTDLNTPEIELFARLAAEGARFDHEPGYLTEFRTHAGSSTASGLFSERLVRYLEPIAVPSAVEDTKRTFMAALTRSAVDRLLRAGEQARAAEIMRSRYYPHSWTDPTLLAQALAVRAPAPLGARAYLLARRLHEARNSWRGRSA